MKCNFMFVVNKRHHSLKITITFHHRFEFAIWEMVSTRLHEKPWKPHRFWVNLSGRRANWIGFSYLSSTTSILCTTNIPSSLHLSPITDSSTHTHSDTAYIKRNVTWTNKYSWVRASTKKLAELVQIHFWRIRVYVETWSQWFKLTQKSLIFLTKRVDLWASNFWKKKYTMLAILQNVICLQLLDST